MINAMQKGGITPFTIEEMEKIIEQAEKTHDDLFPKLEKKIKNLIKVK